MVFVTKLLGGWRNRSVFIGCIIEEGEEGSYQALCTNRSQLLMLSVDLHESELIKSHS